MKVLVVLVVCVYAVHARKEQARQSCIETGDIACLKANLVRNLDKLLHQRAFPLANGVVLESLPGADRQFSGRSISQAELESTLPEDPAQKDEQLDDMLFGKLGRLFSSRALKLSLDSILPGKSLRVTRGTKNGNSLDIGFEEEEEEQTQAESARTGPLRIRRFLPILLFFKYKLFVMGALFLFFVTAISGHALMAGKVALLISALIGLKKLNSGNTTYEIVSQPYYTHTQSYGHEGGHGHGHGHGRGFSSSQSSWVGPEVAYRGYNGRHEN